MEITYRYDLEGVDWEGLREMLLADHFDNGRTPEQYRASFENSAVTVLAWQGGRIIGTARALSDGVCNAYVVDVWTLTAFRGGGVARRMMEMLEEKLWGEHVYLFTDDQQGFYRRLGYQERGTGFEKVKGRWLVNSPD